MENPQDNESEKTRNGVALLGLFVLGFIILLGIIAGIVESCI